MNTLRNGPSCSTTSLRRRAIPTAAVLLCVWALACLWSTSAAQAQPAASPALTIVGRGEPLMLTPEALRAMPHQTLALLNPHSGQTETYEGIPLLDLLTKAGAPLGEHLRGPELATAVLAEASDGYRVVFGLGELDSGTGDAQVLLADRMNGAPLDAKQGPLKLVVPRDKRPARWIRQLTTLRIVMVGGPPAKAH
jgi:hypothetical protein